MESCLLEYRMIKYAPSILAGAALFLSRKILAIKPEWPGSLLEKSFKVDIETLNKCAKDMMQIIKRVKMSSCKIITIKYASEEYFEVVKYIEPNQNK